MIWKPFVHLPCLYSLPKFRISYLFQNGENLNEIECVFCHYSLMYSYLTYCYQLCGTKYLYNKEILNKLQDNALIMI